jgi:hypothetical protein
MCCFVFVIALVIRSVSLLDIISKDLPGIYLGSIHGNRIDEVYGTTSSIIVHFNARAVSYGGQCYEAFG